jgi:hypothetical protein
MQRLSILLMDQINFIRDLIVEKIKFGSSI